MDLATTAVLRLHAPRVMLAQGGGSAVHVESALRVHKFRFGITPSVVSCMLTTIPEQHRMLQEVSVSRQAASFVLVLVSLKQPIAAEEFSRILVPA